MPPSRSPLPARGGYVDRKDSHHPPSSSGDLDERLPPLPTIADETVTKPKDKWVCGDHVLVCEQPVAATFKELVSEAPAVCAFIDPLPLLGNLEREDFADSVRTLAKRVSAQVAQKGPVFGLRAVTAKRGLKAHWLAAACTSLTS